MISWLGGIALLIPLLSALQTPAIPIAFRILLVVLWVLALIRPHRAIAALIVVVPFASWLLVTFNAPPVRYAEALVLAVLSGAIIATAQPPRTPLAGQRPALGPAAGVFFAVVLASAAVMLQVMQAGTHAPWPFVRDFLVFLTRDYLVGPPGSFAGVADAALLIEGIGLALLVAHHARDHVVRPGELFAAIAVSGVLAAAVTLSTFVATALQASTAREFFAHLAFSRMGVHVSDVNAAGSFFAMTTILAVAHAMNERFARRPHHPGAHRTWWIAAAVLMTAATWISGSRMALAATFGGLGILAAVPQSLRFRAWPRWAVVTAAVLAALLVVAAVLGLDPRPSASRTMSRMLSTRVDFMMTGLRMVASAPVFGVGIGRYYEMSGRFMPQSIYWFYFHENAHNNFLQIAGELGLAGLAAFAWLLGAAAIRMIRGLLADPGDRLLLGAAIGLAAFVATWTTSHPMLVAEVAYPFWMLVGVAIARADGDAQTLAASPAVADAARSIVPPSPRLGTRIGLRHRSDRQGRRFGAQFVFVGAVIAALAASVPVRAKQQMAATDFGRLSFGFYDWEGDPERRFRWTSRRATFFIPLDAHQLQLQLRAIHVGPNRAPTQVSIAIGGRTFHKVWLADDDWVTVSLRVPLLQHDESFQRIDIITDPTWSPAAIIGGRSDVRVLGVQVAEPVTAP